MNDLFNSMTTLLIRSRTRRLATLTLGLNFIVATVVSRLSAEPPQEVRDLVEQIRIPGVIRGAP